MSRDTEPVAPVSREDLMRRSAALRTALDEGGQAVEPALRERAAALTGKVSERTALAGSRTVAALAGATGSGKSSLFNFLAGEPVSRIGAKRPTTSQASAAVWGSEPSAELLDWLGVGIRHHVSIGQPQADQLDGLVLLDLPDFDSRVAAHRTEADRVLGLVDVFVWVTDPQKYADAVLHDDYVRAMAGHADVTIAVLNQVDRLSPADAQACIADLRRLLERDGLAGVQVIGTSSVTQLGIADLTAALGRVVQSHNAAEQRLAADLRSVASSALATVGSQEPQLPKRPEPQLVASLEKAAGVPVVLTAIERDYVQHARRMTGWPFVSWVDRQRSTQLSRLGLGEVVRDEDIKGMSRSQARAATGRSSLPTASPAARSAIELSARRVAEHAATGLPPAWAHEVQEAALADRDGVTDALDQAVSQTTFEVERPAWWGAVAVLQWLLAGLTVLGLVWTIFMGAVGAPAWGPIPVPPALLVGGLILGPLIAFLCRWVAGRAARRARVRTAQRLNESVAQVADEHLLEPVRTVLDRHSATRRALVEASS